MNGKPYTFCMKCMKCMKWPGDDVICQSVNAINKIISLSHFRGGYKGDHKKKDGSAFQLLLREGCTYPLLSLKNIYN